MVGVPLKRAAYIGSLKEDGNQTFLFSCSTCTRVYECLIRGVESRDSSPFATQESGDMHRK